MNLTFIFIVVSLLLAGVAFGDAPTSQPALRIVLVGDSTVTSESGWGTGFAALLAPNVECINLARGGRSSKSFRDEGHWEPLAGLKPNYVIIQFGHNDQPGKGPERETDPKTTYSANLKRYVEEARAAGAKAILVTSLVRRRFKEDGKIHSDLLAYVEACRAVANETGAPLIELHDRSLDFCNSLGEKACEQDLSPPPKKAGDVDRTHLSGRGSELIGEIVAEELVRVAPELTPYVRLDGAKVGGK